MRTLRRRVTVSGQKDWIKRAKVETTGHASDTDDDRTVDGRTGEIIDR